MVKRNNIMPDDILLFQILPRLPARSIGRFMSVCKQWHSFLKTHEFTKMHLHHVNNENRPKIIALSDAYPSTYPSSYFQTMDCETPEVGFSAERSLPFEINNKKIRILSSLNGLVCVDIDYSDLILWNPLTGEYKKMSKDNPHVNCFTFYPTTYGLYYDSGDDDYKLLCVTRSRDAYIYSWKSESWRKAKSRSDSVLETWNNCNCFMNEKLYFVVQGTQRGTGEIPFLIVRFDTKTEMFTEIATPSSFSELCYNIVVVGGCIHLCVLPGMVNDLKLELWKMDGDGEWTKVMRYSMSLVMYQPCHLMKNGNWMFLSGREVVVYNVIREKEVKGACKHGIDYTVLLLRHGKFMETVVSLKR